jgi:hypothetical protein
MPMLALRLLNEYLVCNEKAATEINKGFPVQYVHTCVWNCGRSRKTERCTHRELRKAQSYQRSSLVDSGQDPCGD